VGGKIGIEAGNIGSGLEVGDKIYSEKGITLQGTITESRKRAPALIKTESRSKPRKQWQGSTRLAVPGVEKQHGGVD